MYANQLGSYPKDETSERLESTYVLDGLCTLSSSAARQAIHIALLLVGKLNIIRQKGF